MLQLKSNQRRSSEVRESQALEVLAQACVELGQSLPLSGLDFFLQMEENTGFQAHV
jgi:hypothetical protein